MKTAIVDNKQRVRLPGLKPGQVVAYEEKSNGIVTLTPLQPVEAAENCPTKVRFVKRGRYTVGVTDRLIDMKALKEALSEFP